MTDAINDLNTVRIVKTPGVLGGKARIYNRRISIQFIVEHHLLYEMTLDDMNEAFSIRPAEVHAALSYYYDNQDEIDELIKAADEFEKESKYKLEETPRIRELKKLFASTITTQEAAKRLGITDRAVRGLIESGTLPAVKIGASWAIHPEDLLLDQVQNRRRGPQPSQK